MTVAGHSAFTKAVEDAKRGGATTLVSTAGVVEKLRALKDEAELDLMARAVQIADAAIDRIGPTIERGVTEQAVAWELEKAMRDGGAEAIAFDIIVAAGPNAAHPHHRAGDKRVQSGEAVVIDMGATYLGYCSDLTRTIIVGEPDDTLRRVFDTVLRAQLAAEERVASGMTGGEADAIGREIIAEAGYGDDFGHSLGHGIGLAVHEYPRVGPGSEDPLENGMVFSIEPGIYVPGWGGVRIEDLVVLENGRARVLTKARK
jgi:Xaa-Pro aminopeptidase